MHARGIEKRGKETFALVRPRASAEPERARGFCCSIVAIAHASTATDWTRSGHDMTASWEMGTKPVLPWRWDDKGSSQGWGGDAVVFFFVGEGFGAVGWVFFLGGLVGWSRAERHECRKDSMCHCQLCGSYRIL